MSDSAHMSGDGDAEEKTIPRSKSRRTKGTLPVREYLDSIEPFSMPNLLNDSGQVSIKPSGPVRVKVLGVDQQIKMLQALFPELQLGYTWEWYDTTLRRYALPMSANGWFVIPLWRRLTENYAQAVRLLLSRLNQVGTTVHSGILKIMDEQLWRQSSTDESMEGLGRMFQLGDALILPAQFGEKNAGSSVQDVLDSCDLQEWGLGLFEVLWMVHAHLKDLVLAYIDAPGDAYRLHPKGIFDFAPTVSMTHRTIHLDYRRIDHENVFFGSATATRPRPQ